MKYPRKEFERWILSCVISGNFSISQPGHYDLRAVTFQNEPRYKYILQLVRDYHESNRLMSLMIPRIIVVSRDYANFALQSKTPETDLFAYLLKIVSKGRDHTGLVFNIERGVIHGG